MLIKEAAGQKFSSGQPIRPDAGTRFSGRGICAPLKECVRHVSGQLFSLPIKR
jgi:hypothetical protein